MAGTIIDMSKVKQLLQLKKAGISNRQIAKSLKLSGKTGADWDSVPEVAGTLLTRQS